VADAPRFSIGITTRNRPASLARCIASLGSLVHLDPEVLVFDDGSDPPASDAVGAHAHVRVIRDERAPGYIVGRNALVAAASYPLVLLLDDDTALLENGAVEAALAVMARDPDVAAVGFAQANADGSPWPESMQPARGHEPRYAAAYIGFAHLLRRDVFMRLGGYRGSFVHYGEEKDYCLRLLDAGYHIVYLPGALLLHLPDPAGRSRQRYLRYVVRNDMLQAFYNEPLGRAVWVLPLRFLAYFRMRRHWGIDDPRGWWWVLTEVAGTARRTRGERHPVSRRTLAEWRRLRDHHVAYGGPGGRS
jgi:GT2 family glycosyltransferase